MRQANKTMIDRIRTALAVSVAAVWLVGTGTSTLVVSFGSCPAMEPSMIAESRTVRPNGPA